MHTNADTDSQWGGWRPSMDYMMVTDACWSLHKCKHKLYFGYEFKCSKMDIDFDGCWRKLDIINMHMKSSYWTITKTHFRFSHTYKINFKKLKKLCNQVIGILLSDILWIAYILSKFK